MPKSAKMIDTDHLNTHQKTNYWYRTVWRNINGLVGSWSRGHWSRGQSTWNLLLYLIALKRGLPPIMTIICGQLWP